jgi:hypothetical protein
MQVHQLADAPCSLHLREKAACFVDRFLVWRLWLLQAEARERIGQRGRGMAGCVHYGCRSLNCG